MRATWLVVAGLGGCAAELEESTFEPSNLEAPRVTPTGEISGRLDILGTLSVAPDGTGWEVAVTSPSAEFVVEVVSPGGADLSVFDGIEARLAVAASPGTDQPSVAILTPRGEPLYLLEPVRPGVLTDTAFGRGLVGRGNDLGPVRRAGWAVGLRSAWLRTDGVDLELLPGAPRAVFLRDEQYRVVLLSAWDLEEAAEGCDVPGSRLAFEVVRVDGWVDETPLQRDPTVPLVGATCDDAG
jgi:hypothetical protein